MKLDDSEGILRPRIDHALEIDEVGMASSP